MGEHSVTNPPQINGEVLAELARVIELLEQIAETLARIEARAERTNELLADISKSV